MRLLSEFVSEHLADDTTRLILNKDKWPEIDMQLAVNCIESRRKLKGKVQEWYDDQRLIFPIRLSSEQCSSSATALYKANLAERICQKDGLKAWNLADLTGGLGVDSWFFSKRAEKVLYNEMQTQLCKASEYNFGLLGASNIVISNKAIISGKSKTENEISPEELLKNFKPDIVFIDPARRSETGKKVFLIEDCCPDVLTLKDEIFRQSRNILIKLSPMADIAMVCSRLGEQCREIHVVGAGGECKELLIWMDKEWKGEYTIHTVELDNSSEPHTFTFLPSEEKSASADYSCEDPSLARYLFEPGKAMMKAGCYNLISVKYGLTKLGKSTHYYITSDYQTAVRLKGLGKIYKIISSSQLDKRSIKSTAKDFPKAEVTARNIPMDTDSLRKKLGVTSGGDAHIFGLHSDKSGNLLIIGVRESF